MTQNYNPEFLYLTTKGWKTGQSHEIEIWFVSHNGCHYLCAERGDRTHWVQNIQHQAAVGFWVNGQSHTGTGRALDPAAEAELTRIVSALFDQKYNWSAGLLVELRPGTP